jgi:16S rRNA (uracil1498-N3)-methyltransferase
MAARFYTNWPLAPGPFALEGAEAHHLAGVSRIRPGDQVTLFNGDGAEYPARVLEVGKRSVLLDVQGGELPSRELPFALEVAAPLPKGDRTQFLVEKLTELGVTRFVPLLCERSVIEPRAGKLEKLERYVVEASKQCGRNRLMRVQEAAAWTDYVQPRESEIRLLAHPAGGPLTIAPESPARPIRVAVGPEGGFAQPEVEEAMARGWIPVGLGPRVLRIETAAIVMAGLLGR